MSSDKTTGKLDALEELSLEHCYDMTYMGYVMQETLRLNPVA